MSRKCHSLVFEVRQDLHAALNAGLVVLEEVVADGFGVGNLKLTLRSGSLRVNLLEFNLNSVAVFSFVAWSRLILFSIDQPKSFCSCFVVIWMECHCPLSHWSSLFEEAPSFSKSLGHTGGVGLWEVQVKWIKTERHGDTEITWDNWKFKEFKARFLRRKIEVGFADRVGLHGGLAAWDQHHQGDVKNSIFNMCFRHFRTGHSSAQIFPGQIRSCQAVKIHVSCVCGGLSQTLQCPAILFLQGLDIPLPQYALLHPVMRCASRISMWIWISCLAAKPWCGTISKASSNGLPSRPNSIQFDVKCLVNLYRSKAESPPFPSGLTWADLIAFRGSQTSRKTSWRFFMFFGLQI